jgi:hypothetical protein
MLKAWKCLSAPSLWVRVLSENMLEKKSVIVRQGDVLLRSRSSLPRGSRKTSDNVLARGETTGHSHRIEGAKVYRSPSDRLLVVVEEEASLVHEEHKQLQIPKGIYEVIHQREYDPLQRQRTVLD